jgi:hypothetical protein
VSDFNYIPKIKGEFNEALSLLPEYHKNVHKLGVFIAHKLDMEIKLKSAEYTKLPNPEPWNSPYGNLMMSFFYHGIQSILVFFEDYVKASENDIRRTILHEMGHAICGHECRTVNSPSYFGNLSPQTSSYIQNQLINLQEDFEVDSFLAKKVPEVVLEYIYNYALNASQSDIKKIFKKIPAWAKRLETYMLLVEYYRNLLVLKHLPKIMQDKRKYKKAKKKFTVLFKSSRLWLQHILKKSLPSSEELITESAFKDQYQLKLWFCKIVELDTKKPNI